MKDYQLRCCACDEPYNASWDGDLNAFDDLCPVCVAQAMGFTDEEIDADIEALRELGQQEIEHETYE